MVWFLIISIVLTLFLIPTYKDLVDDVFHDSAKNAHTDIDIIKEAENIIKNYGRDNNE